MKKMVICFLFIFIILNICAITSVYAGDGILDQAQSFIEAGESMDTNVTSFDTQGFEELAGLLQGTGILIAVGVAIVLGIRFMMASAKQRSEILQSVAPFLIGTIIIVGAVVIWKILIEVLDVV